MINLSDFDYPLPPGRIAQYPKEVRDQSKLLVVQGQSIKEEVFSCLPAHLPPHSFIVFNDTRVIRARLLFSKPTGGIVEIFCLDPILPAEPETAFLQTGQTTWKCLVGNSKKWKSGTLELNREARLFAERQRELSDGTYEILFHWEPASLTFSEILASAGHIPLPPYIRREDNPQDNDRYQTIYALHDGSVAAPTAGLHFTDAVMGNLRQIGCDFGYVTLHVGVGTFRPVTEEDLSRHVMHHERINIAATTIRELLEKRHNGIIAVGTTAARTLESMYWAGVKLLTDGDAVHPETGQWDPYDERYNRDIPVEDSLKTLLHYLVSKGQSAYRADTQLMIVPGYRFRVVNGLITNFHMPKSTLLLLVSAFAGEIWKEAYQFALDHDFRFLSYGDACLFLK